MQYLFCDYLGFGGVDSGKAILRSTYQKRVELGQIIGGPPWVGFRYSRVHHVGMASSAEKRCTNVLGVVEATC
jgi:hypothetical protein